MKFTITLKNNTTGEEKIHIDDYDYKDDPSGYPSAWEHFSYQWGDGNFGCDCNRFLFMYGRDKYEEEERECSSGKINLIKIVDNEGQEYSIDGFNIN